jgi:hypothetical protein
MFGDIEKVVGKNNVLLPFALNVEHSRVVVTTLINFLVEYLLKTMKKQREYFLMKAQKYDANINGKWVNPYVEEILNEL